MRYTYRLLAGAQTDLLTARDWYHAIDPALAERFAAVLSTSFETICHHPLSYLVVGDRARRSLVPGFPYRILFRVSGNEIRVIAILHTRRHPEAGTRRH